MEKKVFFFCARKPAEASPGKAGAFLGLWHLSRYRRQMTEIAVRCNENEEGNDATCKVI